MSDQASQQFTQTNIVGLCLNLDDPDEANCRDNDYVQH